MIQRLLHEACRVAGVDPALVKKVTLEPDENAPVDILLELADGTVRRVELSALPAEALLTRPAPEHATLTEPEPERLEAEPEKPKRKAPGAARRL